MLKAKLLVVGGDAKTAEVKLRLPTVIGRGKEGVTLTLPHQLVSRKHTEIFEKDNYLCVRDLGSLNGTYVNNKRISEPQILKPNELLTLGNVTFRAVYEVPEGVPVPAAPVVGAAAAPVEEVKFEEVAPEKVEVSAKSDTAEQQKKDANEKSKEAPVVAASPEPSQEPKQSNGKPEMKSREPVKTESVEAKSAADSDKVPEKQAIDVLDEADDASDGSSKTDRSLIGFALDEEVAEGLEKSISLSALDGLPDGQAQVSFVGNMSFEGAEPSVKEVEAVELDLGAEAKPAEASESGLGSFLKKLPK